MNIAELWLGLSSVGPRESRARGRASRSGALAWNIYILKVSSLASQIMVTLFEFINDERVFGNVFESK